MTALDSLVPGVARGGKRPVVYCRSCLIPETKPDILFDDHGVCSACRHYESRGEGSLCKYGNHALELVKRHDGNV